MRIHAAFARFAAATDAERMAIRLGPELQRRGIELAGKELSVSRVLPRKQGGYTIQYRLPEATAGGYLCGHLLGDQEPVPGYAAKAGDSVIACEDLGLIVPVFPFDPRLEALPDACTATGGAELLGVESTPVRASVLAYRLEKRCVIRYVQDAVDPADPTNSSAVAKLVPRSRLARFVAGHRRLLAAIAQADAGQALTVPEILRVDERRSAYVMEDVPGTSLHALDGDPTAVKAYAAAGGALRCLHGLPAVSERLRTREDEVDQLDAWTARIAPMFPDLTARFAAGAHRVREAGDAAPLAGDQAALVHGDFYDKQVLHTPERVTILDTDNLTLGDAAQDIGNFSAHVRLRQIQHPQHASSLAACLDAFLAGYGEIPPALARRITWWRAATLLRLAGLYALRPQWRRLAPTLLEEIDSCSNTGAAVQ